MNSNQTVEAMIFDLDGTLFKAETLMLPAYHQTFEQLREEGLYTGPTPPEERILSALGMLLDDIWKKVMPEADKALRVRANDLLLKYQMVELEHGGGELYPQVAETLQELRERNVRLFVASNGLEGYVKSVVQAKGLHPLFEALYSAGEYKTSTKVELVKLLLQEHRVQSAWMVGDRSSDVEAGKENGLRVIGCRYADFGDSHELDQADAVINSFSELLNQ